MKIRHAFILKNELVGEEGKQMEERNRVPKDEGILSSIYLDGICQTLVV